MYRRPPGIVLGCSVMAEVIVTMATVFADLILFVHVLYASFVLGGFLLLPLALWRRWRWAKARAFRLPHLVCTAVVAVEALIGLTCPLTWLEHALLAAAGAPGYERSFVGHFLYWFLYYEAPASAFIGSYTTLTIVVVALYYYAPPQPSSSH